MNISPRQLIVAAMVAAGVIVSLTAAPAVAKGKRDASVGVCTRKGEFAKKQAKLDKQVAALTAATDDKKRAKLVKALVKTAEKEIEGLIRYREPAVAPVLVQVAATSKKWFTRTRALYALRHVGDASVVPGVADVVDDKDPMVREAAALTLAHLGGDDAIAALEARADEEKDEFVSAALTASLALARAETKPWEARKDGLEWKETLAGPEGAKRVEWNWVWKGQRLFNDYDAKSTEYPEATRFVYPIQKYEEDLFAGYPRDSFAAGGNHAGEDCAWFRDGCGYYSIADGIVRMVQGAGGDWGFLVSVEHRLPDGRYMMSVYGHAGFDVLVKPGDVVTAGQLLATQGLSCSIENGGYGAHLHFGLGDGPFRRPKGAAVGDTVNVKDADGKPAKGEILRLTYAPESKNSYGWPLTAMVVELQDGTETTVEIPEQGAAEELSWFQAYIQECRGWLDPQTLLPELVSGSK